MTIAPNPNIENIRDLFERTFVPVSLVGSMLNYSPQYARRLVGEQAVEEVDLFIIHGRQYVTAEFVQRISTRR